MSQILSYPYPDSKHWPPHEPQPLRRPRREQVAGPRRIPHASHAALMLAAFVTSSALLSSLLLVFDSRV